MNNRGLNNSIWASGRRDGVRDSQFSSIQPGDWSCPKCQFSNFQRRTNCFQCGFSHANDIDPDGGRWQGNIQPIQTSQASEGQSSILGGRGGQTPARTTASTNPRQDGEHGLGTSRWAPRGLYRSGKLVNANDVWTKTITVPDSRNQSPNRKYPISSKAPDLGLPFQVQHYVLTLVQRLLEEACYDFAMRWIPQKLSANGWDCAEAVELSTWRDFLPTNIPPNSIKPLSSYTLEAALIDAVRVRNSAVHKHLRDNVELRKMALKAQDLMAMFADGSRQEKFYLLYSELRAWDTASMEDPHTARNKLEAALREISEKPLDDMDWTPNAVSLQEIPYEEEKKGEYLEYPSDEMELD